MITLSLLIATYNRAARLIDTLESVVEQDAPAEQWECVVVNNNSTDDTAARFTAFAAAHPQFNLRMVEEHNQGLSYARNRGIRESTGVYIAIMTTTNVSPRPSSRPISHSSIRSPRLLRAEGPSCRYIRRGVRRGCRVSRSGP